MDLEYALYTMDTSTARARWIQYSVLKSYWEDFGPILTREANDLMETGNFQKVLITLIPKNNVAESKDIKDQRPISLSNTVIKVISKAVCRRLQKLMDVLVGPYQRGLIRDRRINQNTMEFFTMLERLKQQPSSQMGRRALLMMEFTKAFDRISHQYMRQVLMKMGLGSSIVRLIMSILNDQEAQISLNNWEGEKISSSSWYATGKSLIASYIQSSVGTFLDANEGIRQGFPEYEGNVERMKYHAFTDDVNIYLGSEADYDKVAAAIRQLERLSNSPVSETKTKLLGFQVDYTHYHQQILPYPQSYIWSEEWKYWGLTLEGVDWKKFISKLRFMTLKQGYMQIDLITRAIGTNVFVASKAIYKDLVQCMSNQQLKKMDSGIHAVFKGHRTAVLLSTLNDDMDWYTKYFRLKLTHHMAKIMKGRRNTPIAQSQGLHVADFLLERTGSFFKNLKWTFTSTEICYIEAWKEVVPRARIYETSALVPDTWIQSSYEAPARGENGFSLTEEEEKQCHPSNFSSLSKKKQKALPPVMPGHFLELCPEAGGKRRWEKFWKTLHKLEWKKRKDLEALHHFNFGSYVPMHDTRRPITGYKCQLCLQEVNSQQIQRHIYNDCGCSKFWWNHLNIEDPMTLNSMMAPLHKTYEALRNLNWYVQTVRRVYCSRRREANGGNVLQPLSHRQMKKAMGHSKAKSS
ncbi:hypothetical protein JCM33374_g4627 [Metschnikowia sp. JCM 33374]|nr:hypothetical protein JCM33374_g4627 [Metschnikowia sp. JCM 33374]